MTFLSIHALVFLVANGLLVFAWWMLATEETPFWPAWPLAAWGGLLVLHAGVTAVLGLRKRRERRRRRRRERHRPAAGSTGGTSWIAVMFVDLVGSTRLSESLGDEAWSEMIATFRGIVRDVVRGHDGAEVGTQGDGSLLRFPSPADAVRCAGALVERLDQAREDGEVPAEVRIGIHAGRVVERDDDVLGKVVNVAARVADAAGPGEVLVTEPVLDHADPGVPADDRGLVELAGLGAPRHLLAIDVTSLRDA